MSNLLRKPIYVPQTIIMKIQPGVTSSIFWLVNKYTKYSMTFLYFGKNTQFWLSQKNNQTSFLLPVLSKLAKTQYFYNMFHKQEHCLRKTFFSTFWTQFHKAVISSSSGFRKTLIVRGVGYKFRKENETLSIRIGFSHEIKVSTKRATQFKMNLKSNKVKFKHRSFYFLTSYLALIKRQKKPDIYKGKGIRYKKERIVRKEGKKPKL